LLVALLAVAMAAQLFFARPATALNAAAASTQQWGSKDVPRQVLPREANSARATLWAWWW
jgi:hypothetical protein